MREKTPVQLWGSLSTVVVFLFIAGCGGNTKVQPRVDRDLKSVGDQVGAGPTVTPPPVGPAPPVAAGVATGTEYVSFWSGDLRIFADENDTEVTLIDIDTGLLLDITPPTDTRVSSTNFTTNPFVLDASESFEGIGGLGGINDEIRVRIVTADASLGGADKPVIVWTGSLQFRHPDIPPSSSNPWMSYIPALTGGSGTDGREIGREFLGFTSREMYIFAQVGGLPTSITVDDVATNTDTDTDDSTVLTVGDAVHSDAEIEIYYLDTFEDDTVRVSANVDISVMTGNSSTLAADWTVTPPSYAAGDDGIELGTLFYTFVNQYLTVFPTQDNTTIDIFDLSDGDDTNTSIVLANGDTVGDYDLYTPTLASTSSGAILPRPAGPMVTIIGNGGNPFDNDFVKVVADKPVLVYVGPVGSNTLEFADVAFSVATGPDSRIIYTFAQNSGSSNDLQIFGFDPDTTVTITSLSETASFRGNGQHDFVVGPGLTIVGEPWKEGVGLAQTEVWWGEDIWNAEMLRIESDKPITVINGDYDTPQFGAFIPFVLATPTLPPVAVAAADPTLVCPGDDVNLDGGASFDSDTVAGGMPITYEWDFDITFDSDFDAIPDNDVDATGSMVTTSFPVEGLFTVQLTFTDDDGESDTDFVVITVDLDAGDCVKECPRTQGFWKNHEERWPFDTILLGDIVYTQAEALDLLRTEVIGDASLNLAHQLIAAKLNLANGTEQPPAVVQAVASADALLSGGGMIPQDVDSQTALGQQMIAVKDILDAFNMQQLTPECVESF